MLERLFRSPALLLVAAGAVIAAAFVAPWWERDFYWDSAVFGGLARSLLDGEGYRFMGEPHGKYPPGFPLMLAAVQFVGLGLRGVHVLIGVSAIAAVVLSYFLLRERHGRWFAFGAAGLTLLNHAFVEHQSHVLSDLPFLALSLATLLAAQRLQRDGRWSSALLTLVLGVLAASVRGIGVALAPAIVMGLLARRRGADDASPSWLRLAPQSALIAISILAMVGGWMVYGESVTRENQDQSLEEVTYHQELTREDAEDPDSASLGPMQFLDRIRSNTVKQAELTAELLDGRKKRTGVPVYLFAAIVLVGWGIAFWRRRGLIDWYFPSYLAVLSVWSGPEGTRFLLGVLPFVYHYVFCALAPWSLAKPGPRDGSDDPSGAWTSHRRASQAVLATVVMLTLATSAWPDFRVWRAHLRRPYYTARVQEFREALDWVRTQTPADRPIVTDRAPMAHVLTGRPAYKFAHATYPHMVIDSIARHGRPIVVVNDFHAIGPILKPVIAARPDLFHEIHRIGRHVVYQFEPETDPGAPGSEDD